MQDLQDGYFPSELQVSQSPHFSSEMQSKVHTFSQRQASFHTLLQSYRSVFTLSLRDIGQPPHFLLEAGKFKHFLSELHITLDTSPQSCISLHTLFLSEAVQLSHFPPELHVSLHTFPQRCSHLHTFPKSCRLASRFSIRAGQSPHLPREQQVTRKINQVIPFCKIFQTGGLDD
jgi:hypothetical protein